AALWTLGRRSAALGALYLVLVTPLIVPMVQELRDPQHYMVRPRYDTLVHSADLLAAFVPNPLHPLWRAWGEQLNARLHTEGVLVTTVSLSYVALGLALVGTRRQWQRARFWVVCGMVFWVLSLGPQLQVLGRMTAIHLPYELLFQLKVIQISRAPARYMIPAELCLAILAAIGTQSLQGTLARFGQRLEGHQDRGASRWLSAVIILALSFELLPAPARVTPPAPTPSFFVDRTLRNAGALLEVPNPSNVGMYYATLHGRPVLYGELSRDNPATPLVEYLRHGYWRDEIMAANMQNWECVAGFFDVTHAVIYHVDKPEVEVATAALQERLGSVALVRDTPEATLYQLPTSATSSSDTCLVPGAGWGTPRPFGADQPVYRWAGQQASLEVLQPTPGRIRLHFMAHSFGHARQLQVRVGDQLAGQFTVGVSPQPLAVEFDVPAGRTLVELHSVEPATVPADFGFPETEPVTIGFSQVQAEVED
ncbi:MAG: hypothetical protein M3380_06840, partial [Chloroflexota bacterium]|nr:hypothetical protein [Chloroflexota bacterium]